MKRVSKAILCALTITLIVCTFSIPCFATWNLGKTQVYTTGGSFDEYLAPTGAWSQATANNLVNTVKYATEANAFNGQVPIAIYMTYQQVRATRAEIKYFVVTTSKYMDNTDLNQVAGRVDDNNILRAYNSINSNVFDIYSFTNAGSFFYETSSNGVDISIQNNHLSNTPDFGVYLVALKNVGDTWEISPNNNNFTSRYEGNYSNALNISTNWMNAWESVGYNVTNNYELDIPSIITAVPNGAKQIINNTFGFEIFGINVAGLLSVILIVTIVAFVVKWLMSR